MSVQENDTNLSIPQHCLEAEEYVGITVSVSCMPNCTGYAKLKRFYQYYLSLYKTSDLPRWSDVDLESLYDIASTMFVADLEETEDGRTYRYRYVGTKIVSHFGIEPTRKTVEEVYEGNRAEAILKAYDQIIESEKPQCAIRSQANLQRDYIKFAVLTAPLFNSFGKVEKLIGVKQFL